MLPPSRNETRTAVSQQTGARAMQARLAKISEYPVLVSSISFIAVMLFYVAAASAFV
jgi:hypothetical protein